MATFPVLKVEIAFVSNPLDTAPTWTDVTQYVRHANGVDITRGRSDPWSHFTAGRLTLTFSNRDRRFDSLYSAGPYFGNLKPGKQIRVTCTWSAVTYDLFRGFVGTWPQEFSNAGKDATVTVDCYDGLEWAAGTTLSSEPYGTALSGQVRLRQADTSRWDDAADTYEPDQIGVAQVGPSMVPGITGSQSVIFTGSNWYDLNKGFTPAVNGLSGNADNALSFWITTTATTGPLITGLTTSSTTGTQVTLVSGKIQWFGGDGGANTSTSLSSKIINDGRPHFVVIQAENNNAIWPSIYIDGYLDSLVSNSSTGAGVGGGNFVYVVGSDSLRSARLPSTILANTSLQDVAAFGTSHYTAAQILSLYQLGLGYAAESSATRFTRYLDDAGWPATWRDVTTTPAATVNTLVYNNQQLITSLQELESSEQGRIFVSKSGNFTLHARYFNQDVTRGNTSQATFTDDGTAFSYRDFGYTQDDTDVRNDVTVTNTVGSSRSTDSTSITANRRRSETVNTILSTVDQRQAMAAGLVVQWKDATVRVKDFLVAIPSNWATFLNLEIGDRITVKQTPMGVGTQFSKDLIIDSISWRITADFWEMRIAAAPVTPNGLNWFVLDTSALDGADVLGY